MSEIEYSFDCDVGSVQYENKDGIQLERRLDMKSPSCASLKKLNESDEEYDKYPKDKNESGLILRGPLWNYGSIIRDEKTYYSELLFGRKRGTILAPDDLILKGETWVPSRPTRESLSAFIMSKMKKADPESVALMEIETGRSLTYKEVLRQASSLASGLYWAGVESGHVIAVVSFNSIEVHLMILASLLMGAVTALVDPSLSPVEMGKLLQISNPRMVFCECGRTAKKVETALGHVITSHRPSVIINVQSGTILQDAWHMSFQKLLVEVDSDFKPVFKHYKPSNPVFILFTYGVSEKPHGVLISENFFMKSRIFIDSILSISKCPYTILLTKAIFCTIGIISLLVNLVNRHEIVFFRGQAPEAVLIKVFHKFKITVWITGPEHILQLLKWPVKPLRQCVKLIWVTGMSIGEEALIKIKNKVFEGNVEICQIYGMSETGIATANMPHLNKLGSVGKLLWNVQMKVMEEGTGLALGPNQKGELCFRSESMMLGYYKTDGTETFFDKEGFIHTGDLGYYDDSHFVFILGKLKDVIKWKCYQIIPQEVEDVLLKQPAVKEAVVVGLPHDTDGQLVAAVILLNPGYENTDLSSLEKIANNQLPPSKKIRGGIYHMLKFPYDYFGKPIKVDIMKELLKHHSKQTERTKEDISKRSVTIMNF